MCMGKAYPSSPSDREYQAEDDHRTLTRASEIQGDKARMAGVKKQHGKLTRNLKRVGRSLGAKR